MIMMNMKNNQAHQEINKPKDKLNKEVNNRVVIFDLYNILS